MTHLTDAQPPVSAIHDDPFSAGEIDAHPDRDRIWATIQAVKAEMADEDDWSFFGEEED